MAYQPSPSALDAPALLPAHNTSAVAWSAVLAGAAAAAALSLILLVLGTGLGLPMVSPWSNAGVSATTFGVAAIVWLAFMHLVASGVGGYLAGRLRTAWVDVQRDEVYFRDTAHGLLAWAVATLSTAALLTSVVGALVGGGVQAGAALAGGAATAAVGSAATAGGAAAAVRGDAAGGAEGPAEPRGMAAPMGYFVDALFRPEAAGAPAATPASGAASASTEAEAPAPTAMAPAPASSGPLPSAEVSRILANALRNGALAPADQQYLAQLVAQRTGMSPARAQQRVNELYAQLQARANEAETKAREAADAARKATAYASLWMFVSLLIGAFTASLLATVGGRQRDA